MSDPELRQPDPETAAVPQQPRLNLRARVYLVAAGVVVLAAGALVAFLLLRKGEKEASWVPDPALLRELGEEVEVGGYRIRPPRDYQRTPVVRAQEEPDDGVYIWLGPVGAEGAIPDLAVSLTPALGLTDSQLEVMLDIILQGTRQNWRAWIQEPVEVGRVNGLKFFRARWRGIRVFTGQPMRGFVYLGRDGDTLISINGHDVEPDHEQPRRLAETAALTFRKP